MPRIFDDLDNISPIAANTSFSIQCPVGLTYDKISLVKGGTSFTDAQLTDLQVKINGEVIIEFDDAAELDEYNAYYGRSKVTNIHTFYFNRPEFHDLVSQRMTGLGTADIETLTITGKITGATAPTLTASAIKSEPQPLGVFVRIKKNTHNASGTTFQIADMPKLGRIIATHFKKSDVNKTKLIVDGRQAYRMDKGTAEAFQKDEGRAPVTGKYTHVDFCLEGDVSKALVTEGLNDFTWTLELGTSGSFESIVEYFGGL